jgi:outer membrane protein
MAIILAAMAQKFPRSALRYSALASALVLFGCRGAFAGDAPVSGDEAIETAVNEPRPLWEVGLAAGGGTYANYPASSDYRFIALPLPYFIYRGGLLRSDANGPRLHAQSANIEWELSGTAEIASSSQSGARKGMPRLDNLLEGGPKARVTIFRPSTDSRWFVDLPLRAAITTNFSSRLDSRGVTFSPSIVYEDKSIIGSRWGGRLSLGATTTTSGLQRYWYQVDPQFVTPERPAYQAHSGYLGSTLSLTVFRAITPHLNIILSGDLNSYEGAANQDSPLFKDKTGYSLFGGFAWSIWQSERREHGSD